MKIKSTHYIKGRRGTSRKNSLRLFLWACTCTSQSSLFGYLFKGLRMPLHILGQDSCDQIYIIGKNNRVTTMKVKGTHKDIFLKTLSKDLFMKFNGIFRTNNTIIIDDSPMKDILNNSKNVLFLVSWSHDGRGQNNTFLINMLLPWLQQLHRTQDIRVAARVLDKIGTNPYCLMILLVKSIT